MVSLYILNRGFINLQSNPKSSGCFFLAIVPVFCGVGLHSGFFLHVLSGVNVSSRGF